MDDTDDVQLVRASLPDQLVAYALNLRIDDLENPSLSKDQRAALQILRPLAEAHAAAEDETERNRVRLQLVSAAPEVTTADVGLLSYLRSRCGEALPKMTSTADPVEASLLTLVRDLFALLYFDDWPFTDFELGLAIESHPARADLIRNAYADSDLKRLFVHRRSGTAEGSSEGTDLQGVWAQLQLRSGSGGGLLLKRLPELLALYSLNVTSLYGELSIERAFFHAREGLGAARALARGEEATLPVIIAFSYLELSPGLDRVELSQGTLKVPDASSIRPIRMFTATQPRPISVILIGRYKERIVERAHQKIDVEKHYPEHERHWSTIRRTADMLRYSMLLGIEATPRPTPVADLYMEVKPFQFIMSAGSTHQSVRLDLQGFVVVPEHIEAFKEWSRIVETVHPRSLDIAMRRVISAAASRFDPLDGFIDAVMAWENLFGDTPETTFKVCASLAVLLEPDDNDGRDRLFKALKTLYGTRSRLVHGAAEPMEADAYRFRDEALNIALRALRSAYHTPRLMASSQSSDRVKAILLHGVRSS